MNEETRMKAINDQLTSDEWQELVCIPTKRAVKEYWTLVKDEKRKDGTTPALKDEKALSDLLHRAFHKNNINGEQEKHQNRSSKTSGGRGGRIWLNRIDCLEFLTEWIPAANRSVGRITFDWGKAQRGVKMEVLELESTIETTELQQPVEAKPTPQTFLEKTASLLFGLKERFYPRAEPETETDVATSEPEPEPEVVTPELEPEIEEYLIKDGDDILTIVQGKSEQEAKAQAFDILKLKLDTPTERDRQILKLLSK